ncbi:hypothetical protein GCM10029964_072740 [Kibdelosporangium lantanae]
MVAEFPDYEPLAVKRKSPRPGSWTTDEHRRPGSITDEFAGRSGTICERCGLAGSRRAGRPVLMAPCDSCAWAAPADANFEWCLRFVTAQWDCGGSS